MWTDFLALLVFLLAFSVLSVILHWFGEAIDYILFKLGAEDHDSEWW